MNNLNALFRFPVIAKAFLALQTFVLLISSSQSNAQPTVAITSMPPYGEPGSITGMVVGANPETHHVAPYIQIEGAGWWTKPNSLNPTVPINSDGTFTANVTTGGLDHLFTIVKVEVLPKGIQPIVALGSGRVPVNPARVASIFRYRFGRTLDFAGRTWAVKSAPLPVGPGPNYFSDAPSDVWVDDDGLHLTLNHHDGKWCATEVILTESLGYGTYTFKTRSRVDILDENTTFGAFTWDPFGDDDVVPNFGARELDHEDSRWGDGSDPMNSQMVVQPYYVPGNLERYTMPDLTQDPTVTRFFRWFPDRVEFVALLGDHSPDNYPEGSVIHKFVYEADADLNHFIPPPGRETFRFNLYLNDGAPANGQPVEVLITDFQFTPNCALDLALTFENRTLTMDFLLGPHVPVTWNTWMISEALPFWLPLWSVPLPPFPATPFSLPISDFPNLGYVGVLTTFETSEGTICWKFDVVDSGGG